MYNIQWCSTAACSAAAAAECLPQSMNDSAAAAAACPRGVLLAPLLCPCSRGPRGVGGRRIRPYPLAPCHLPTAAHACPHIMNRGWPGMTDLYPQYRGLAKLCREGRACAGRPGPPAPCSLALSVRPPRRQTGSASLVQSCE